MTFNDMIDAWQRSQFTLQCFVLRRRLQQQDRAGRAHQRHHRQKDHNGNAHGTNRIGNLPIEIFDEQRRDNDAHRA